MRHEYDEILTMTSNTGTPASYQFRCNGMFDPNHTGTGIQPLYFDQMTAIYNHYVVFKSTFLVEFITSHPVCAATYLDDDATVVPTLRNALSQPTGKGGLFPVPTTGAHKLSLVWDAKKFFGGDIFDNNNLKGYLTSDPNEQTFFVFLFNDPGAVITTTAQVRFRVIYEAVWMELRSIADS